MNRLFNRVRWVFFSIFILSQIFIFSKDKMEGATYGSYTFAIHSHGQELVVLSGLDHVGISIVADDGVMYMDNEPFIYNVKNKQGDRYDIEFASLNGEGIVNINNHSTSFVDFHSRTKQIGHFGGSINMTASEIQSDARRDIVISSTLVHLRAARLYSLLQIYMIIQIIFSCFGYWVFLKPNVTHHALCKVFNKEHRDMSISLIRNIGIWIPILTALIPLIFII